MSKAMFGALFAGVLALGLAACQSSEIGLAFNTPTDGDTADTADTADTDTQDSSDSEVVPPDGDQGEQTEADGELDGKEDENSEAAENEQAEGETDDDREPPECESGKRQCAENNAYLCVDGFWQKETCLCGCISGECRAGGDTPCTYNFVGCANADTVLLVSDAPLCCPDKTQACAQGSSCDVTRKGCVASPTDGDIDADGESSPSCDDNDLCTTDTLGSNGLCLYTPKTCGTCQVCDSTNGACVCQPGCAAEVCDNQDNNCNNQVDEGGVCDNPSLGLRVELSWDNSTADLNLHVLRPGGIFGRPEEDDPNDCYWHYPTPVWGRAGYPGESPVFSNSSTAGGGEDKFPETVHLALPQNEPLRVLIHYANNSSSWGSALATNVWVKVYFSGQLVASFKENLPNIGYYWNVACIDPQTKTATAITNANGSNQLAAAGEFSRIDSDACLGQGTSCTTACDCAQGYDCANGACVSGIVPVYCCDKPNCPAGSGCFSAQTGGDAFCGFTLTFDKDTQGNTLANKVNVENIYDDWGALLSTTRANSHVMTDPYVLASISGRNSCGTIDTNGVTRWKGPVKVQFVLPGTDTPALVPSASFYSGDTPNVQNGLKVTAYNLRGAKVYEAAINATGKVLVNPSEPITSFTVETNRDPDFVIDDVTVPRIDIPTTNGGRRK